MSATPDPDVPATVHPGRLSLGESEARGLPPLHARVAQYPDCQQLQLWLPADHAGLWTRLVVRDDCGRVPVDLPMADLLNAGCRVLLDTLGWPPGAWMLTIGHRQGGLLRLAVHKADDADPPVLPQSAALGDDRADLAWRDTALQTLWSQMRERIERAEAERREPPDR